MSCWRGRRRRETDTSPERSPTASCSQCTERAHGNASSWSTQTCVTPSGISDRHRKKLRIGFGSATSWSVTTSGTTGVRCSQQAGKRRIPAQPHAEPEWIFIAYNSSAARSWFGTARLGYVFRAPASGSGDGISPAAPCTAQLIRRRLPLSSGANHFRQCVQRRHSIPDHNRLIPDLASLPWVRQQRSSCRGCHSRADREFRANETESVIGVEPS